MLAIVTLFRAQDPPPIASFTHDLNNQTVHVTVKGAVRQEGSYELKKGALMEDVLALAEPLPEAELSKLKLESRLRNNQVVKVPKESRIKVHIEGAVVKPGILQIKQGTLVKDLLELLTFLPEADIEKLNRKRRLRDQEVIHVTVKKVQKQQKKTAVVKRTNEEAA